MEQKDIRRKANTYFFSKVAINAFLVILGAVLIALFLQQLQHQTSIARQRENSLQALKEAVSILETNAGDAEELTQVFHDSNQDMLDNLNELLNSGLFKSLVTVDTEARSAVFQDVVDRSGVDYLFIMSGDGRVLLSPYPEYYNIDLRESGLLTAENLELLLKGTKQEDGSILPALEKNDYGYFYFYSDRSTYENTDLVLILGADAQTLDVQIESLKDVSVVLSRASVGNGGFLFAVDTENNEFLYYENGSEVLTGSNALEAGLSQTALQDGYSGTETINGVRYYCVSRSFGSSTVICAVAETEKMFSNDKYVLFWSIIGFILVMLLSLVYAVIVRNDCVRNVVQTEKKTFTMRNGHRVIFDLSIFKKVFPLMILGVLLIFCISFYTQTLLEISESIKTSVIALDEVSARYEESTKNREIIQSYYNNRFLSKARLMSYLLEEDPSVLNEDSSRIYSDYDMDGKRYFLDDDEGNPLKSVSSSERLQQLCEENDLESIYVYDEDGHTIATNTELWYFTLSHIAGDQSYAFRDILDGKADVLVQVPMMSDVGKDGQYIGVALPYYTTVDSRGDTVYVSRTAYEAYKNRKPADEEEDAEPPTPVTMHRGLLQIGLKQALTDKLLASTDLEYIFSSDMLNGGFIVVFDDTPSHWCEYSPFEARIGMSAEEIGIPANAFTGEDYYGFTRVNGVRYFQYFKYDNEYFVATAIPKDGMYRARTKISLLTAATSLLLILILSGTVTLTTEEEEMLYATISEEQEKKGLDSAIFHVILPSGKRVSTVKAAARWDNRRIPWSERSPEQKLMLLIGVLFGILVFYVLISILGVRTIFEENSIIRYIMSGTWDKSPNIFALSACALVMIFTALAIAIFRIPIRIMTSLLGARSETIGHLLLSVMKYGGAIGSFFYCLYLIGVDSTSLLASASILSLVIGLGAQSLIKDILAGIFIVFEGEFRVGDIVTIGDYRGTVMDIGLRTTKIMGLGGNIKIYNNSDISGVLNMTKEASIASATISIEYGQELEYVEAVMNRELPKLKDQNPRILDGPFYLGVSKLGASGVDLLVICKCREQDILDMGRYLNREVLQIFYRNGINVPFPNVTVSQLDTSSHKTMARDWVEESAEEEPKA